MPRAKRVCAKPGCPTVATGSYCPLHQAEYEAKRGTTTQRGYGHAHQQQRRTWQTKVNDGTVTCARCHQPIQASQPWALDHTDDRAGYLGPSHAACNNQAGGRAAHPTL